MSYPTIKQILFTGDGIKDKPLEPCEDLARELEATRTKLADVVKAADAMAEDYRSLAIVWHCQRTHQGDASTCILASCQGVFRRIAAYEAAKEGK